ncbi:hypothetical protein L9F63_007885, partial [Diploptera punctata]
MTSRVFLKPTLAQNSRFGHALLTFKCQILKSAVYLSFALFCSTVEMAELQKKYAAVVADLPGISQSTVSPVIRKVSTSVAELKLQFITFPNGDEIRHLHYEFHRIACFRAVVGFIDGTHTKIRNPGGEYPEIFRNSLG